MRAGRRLVPTPRAIELRERVSQLVQEAEAVLRPAAAPSLAELVRTFRLRTSNGLVENCGLKLIARVGAAAPGVRLCFVQKVDKNSASLREGTVDLETGVVGEHDGAGGKNAVVISASAYWRGAHGALAEPWADESRPLFEWTAHRRFAAGA